jgi:hypothetical protein
VKVSVRIPSVTEGPKKTNENEYSRKAMDLGSIYDQCYDRLLLCKVRAMDLLYDPVDSIKSEHGSKFIFATNTSTGKLSF